MASGQEQLILYYLLQAFILDKDYFYWYDNWKFQGGGPVREIFPEKLYHGTFKLVLL